MIPIKPAGQGAKSSPAEAAAAFLKPGTITLTSLPPLSLYVHIPWCVRKCPYCDFNSHESKEALPQALYVAALMQELASHLCRLQQRSLVSIFFGGGTPSLFSAHAIEQILNGIAKRLP